MSGTRAVIGLLCCEVGAIVAVKRENKMCEVRTHDVLLMTSPASSLDLIAKEPVGVTVCHA
jgi:hypothetical protein